MDSRDWSTRPWRRKRTITRYEAGPVVASALVSLVVLATAVAVIAALILHPPTAEGVVAQQPAPLGTVLPAPARPAALPTVLPRPALDLGPTVMGGPSAGSAVSSLPTVAAPPETIIQEAGPTPTPRVLVWSTAVPSASLPPLTVDPVPPGALAQIMTDPAVVLSDAPVPTGLLNAEVLAATSTTDSGPSVDAADAGALSSDLPVQQALLAPAISRRQAHRQQQGKDLNGGPQERGRGRSGLPPVDGAAGERDPANPVAAPLALPMIGATTSIPSGPDVADQTQVEVPDVASIREQITAIVPNPRDRSRP